MEISGLGNASTASKSTATESTENKVENNNQTAGAAESKSSVSNESQASLVPPPNATSESGNEPANIPTAESNTGGQVNITV